MIPHEEGASGAGQFTGKPQPVTILYTNWRGETAVRRILIDAIAYGNEALGLAYGRNEWHPEEQWLLSATDADKGERRTFAMSGIKAWGQAAVDAALSASAPASGAERMTAGEVSEWPASYQETFDAIAAATKIQAGMISVSVRDFYRALSYPDRPSTPAPATPPGVPDSVRVLLDQEPELTTFAINPFGGMDIWVEGTNRFCREDNALEYREWAHSLKRVIRSLLATHPAGQNAGSGAWSHDVSAAPQDRTRVLLHDPLWLHPVVGFFSPGGTDPGWREHGSRQRIHSFTSWRRLDKPAPDSTRTGDEGTEWVLVPTRMDVGMIAAFWHWKNTGSDTPGEFGDDCSDAAAYRAMIAARPAAPEAQGVWSFDMEAAPRDGTPLLCVEYDEPEKVVDCHWFRDGNASSWRGSFGQYRRPIAWRPLPAPPSSSGQGGR